MAKRHSHKRQPSAHAAETSGAVMEQEAPATEASTEEAGHAEPGVSQALPAADPSPRDLVEGMDAILSHLISQAGELEIIKQQIAILDMVAKQMQVDLQGVRDVQHNAGGQLTEAITGLAPLLRLLEAVAGRRL